MRAMMMIAAAALAVPAAAPLTIGVAHAEDKTATCTITTSGGNYTGPCQFSSDDTGSFFVSLADNKPLFGEVLSIGMYIQSPGKANAVVQTSGGLTQQWGAATRSTADPACWEGEGFKVCAN